MRIRIEHNCTQHRAFYDWYSRTCSCATDAGSRATLPLTCLLISAATATDNIITHSLHCHDRLYLIHAIMMSRPRRVQNRYVPSHRSSAAPLPPQHGTTPATTPLSTLHTPHLANQPLSFSSLLSSSLTLRNRLVFSSARHSFQGDPLCSCSWRNSLLAP